MNPKNDDSNQSFYLIPKRLLPSSPPQPKRSEDNFFGVFLSEDTGTFRISLYRVIIYLDMNYQANYAHLRASPMAQPVKNLPLMQETQETWIRSLGWEDPLEEEMATHSCILA